MGAEEGTQQRSSRLLSLRGVIVTVGILGMVLVATVSLVITLVTSRESLRDLAEDQARLALEEVNLKTIALFEPQIAAAESVMTYYRSLRVPWPSDDPTTLHATIQMALLTYRSLGPRAFGLVFFFWDNTRISLDRRNETHYELFIVLPSPVSAPGGLSNQSVRILVYHYPFDSSGPPSFTERIAPPGGREYRVRNTSDRVLISTLTGGGFTASMSGYVASSDNRDGVVTVARYIPLGGPLHLRGDPLGMSSLHGAFFTGIFTDEISIFLRDLRVTPNTEVFATDIFGYLIGSSMSNPVETVSEASPGTRVPTGCISTDSSGSLSGSTLRFACRANRLAYGYAPLAAVDRSAFRHDGFRVERFEHDGDAYFVATGEVPLRMGGFEIRLLLFLPEKDVLSDVDRSRNIAIGVVVVLVVLAAVTNFAVVFVLLSPLTGIAARMTRAANLEDDEAEEQLSAMAEVASLQEAYNDMNSELNRIRSFVPQSVLMARVASAAADSDENKDDDDDTQQTRDPDMESLASKRSKKTSSPKSPHESGDFPSSRRSSYNGGLVVAHRRRSPTASVSTHHSAAAFAAAGHLQVRQATVSVLVANVSGFMEALNTRGRAVLDMHLGELVDFVHKTVAAAKGVLATYHGDHFIATFNAVTMCASHATSACKAAVALRDGVGHLGLQAPLRIGVATGRCYVGNVGSKDIKAFSTMGPAFQHASVLERLSRCYMADKTASVAMLTMRTAMDSVTRFRFRFTDIVPLPGRDRGAGPTVAAVGLLLGSVGTPNHETPQGGATPQAAAHDDEWLYVLNSAETADPHVEWNAAFDCLAKGEVDRAREHIEAHETKSAADNSGEARAPFRREDFEDLCTAMAHPRAIVKLQQRMGRYYGSAYDTADLSETL